MQSETSLTAIMIIAGLVYLAKFGNWSNDTLNMCGECDNRKRSYANVQNLIESASRKYETNTFLLYSDIPIPSHTLPSVT